MTPLSQITQLGVGCGLGSTRIEVLGFVKTINSKPDSPRKWSFHIFKIADPDGGFQCEAKFWGRDARDIPINQVIEITDTGNHPGLVVAEDNRGNVQLDVKSSCEIAFIQGSAPQPQRQQAQAPTQQRQAPPQQRQTYQQPQQRAPQQNTQQTRPTTNPGVTVGMALNNACNLIAKFGADPATGSGLARDYLISPQFSSDVWTIASDILRVSRLLEADRLADPAKVRHAPRQPQGADTNPHQAQQRMLNPPQRQEPQHDLPQDAEVTRPLNRQPEQGPGYVDAGLDGDDIPW
jgi:hypothetical protein